MEIDLGLTSKPVEGIGTKAFYTERQLVTRHARHFVVVMVLAKRPDEKRLQVLPEMVNTFLLRVVKA